MPLKMKDISANWFLPANLSDTIILITELGERSCYPSHVFMRTLNVGEI